MFIVRFCVNKAGIRSWKSEDSFNAGEQDQHYLKSPLEESNGLWKLGAGIGLSSQAVARQVFSLKYVFTTVFGMGTGGFHTLRHQRILLATLEIA